MPTYTGTNNGEPIIGSSSGDIIYGYGGDDHLAAGDGADYVDGGDGNDYVLDNDGQFPDQYADTLLGGNGDDGIWAGYLDNANGGSGYDTIVLMLEHTPGAWSIDFSGLWLGGTYTLDGAVIEGFEQLLYMTASNYDDEIILGSLAGKVSGAAGLAGSDHLVGGAGDDNLNGGMYGPWAPADTEYDLLEGGGGNDLLIAGLGDELYGGSGTDRLSFDASPSTAGVVLDFYTLITTGSDTLAGTYMNSIEQIESITGSDFNDVINASLSNLNYSYFYGKGGDDILITGAGENTLDGGTGADSMAGGGANDTYIVDNVGDTVVEYYGGGSDRVDSSITYTLPAEVELLYLTGTTALNGTGNDLNNTIGGNNAVNNLTGGLGDDTLQGRDGADILNGGDGNDRLFGDAGIDRLVGGAGHDTYYIDDAGDVLVEAAGGGTDLVYSPITKVLATNFENLILQGSAAINGTGNTAANSIQGNAGVNTLYGQGGDDTLYGFDGDDTLIGGAGRDVLWGGLGADIFAFGPGEVAGLTPTTADRIVAFSHAEGDKIRVSGIDAIDGGSNNAFTFIGSAAFTGTAGQLRYEIAGGYTTVYGDTNGDGVADLAIALDGSITLIATDFFL